MYQREALLQLLARDVQPRVPPKLSMVYHVRGADGDKFATIMACLKQVDNGPVYIHATDPQRGCAPARENDGKCWHARRSSGNERMGARWLGCPLAVAHVCAACKGWRHMERS